MVSWYVSAIFGGMIGSNILHWQKKKTVYVSSIFLSFRKICKCNCNFQCSCATILAISSLLMLLWDYQFAAVITSRLMAGLAHGILYTVLIAHFGEVAAPEYRGRALAHINLMMTFGIFLFTLTHYANATSNEFYIERLFGIIAFLISIVSLIISSLLTLESPVYLLRIEHEHKARVNMMKLRNTSVETDSLHNEIEEMQKMVNEDIVQSFNLFSEGNFVPLLLMCCVRFIAFLVNNWALNNVQIRLARSILRPVHRQAIPAILMFVRFLMAIVPTFFSDILPRKSMLVVSVGLTTIALLVSGTLILVNHSSSIYVLLAFIVTHQVTVFGIEPAQHILLSEAFPLYKKRWAVTFLTTFEYALQLSVIVALTDVGTSDEVFYGVNFTTAGLVLAVGAILHFTLPETANLSLRQARDVYRRIA